MSLSDRAGKVRANPSGASADGAPRGGRSHHHQVLATWKWLGWRPSLSIPGENRHGPFSHRHHHGITRKSIHALLTFSYWPEDADRAKAVWNDIMGTLKMGEHFDSPLRGPGYNSR